MTVAISLVTLLLLGEVPPAEEGPLLTLEEAIQHAKEGNLELQAAQARLAQARLTSRKAWAGFLPQLSAGASYTRNNTEAKISLPTGYFIRDVGQPQGPAFDPGQPPSPENPPGAQTSYILFPSGFTEAVIQRQDQLGAQAQLNQALIAPTLWSAIHNAYLAERVVELNVENARREILFAAAQLYYGAAGMKETWRVQERLLEIARAHERDARIRFEAGAAPKVSLLRAEIDRVRAEQDVKRAQNSYAAAKLSLATLLGRDAHFTVQLPSEPALPEAGAGEEEEALKHRPDVVAAQVGVRLAEGQRTGVRMKYLPTVGLSAVYRLANVSGFTGQYDSFALTVGLSWSLFDGGLREAELQEAGARIAEAEANRLAAERKARDEVARARLELDSARANRVKAQEQLRLARESFELVNLSFRSGAATYLEVADASGALLGAELGAVGEALNANLAALRLLKAAGMFNP